MTIRLHAPLRSLQFKLMMAIIAVTLGFVWGLAIFTATRLEAQIKTATMDKQFALTQYIAGELDQKVRERLDGLQGIAARLDVSRLNDAAYLQDFLESRFVFQQQFTGGTAIIGTDGRTVADFPIVPGRRGTWFGDRDYFRQAQSSRKPFIDKPIMGRALKRPVMTMSTPLLDAGGEFRGVMTGIVDLTAPNFLGLMTRREILGNYEFFVISTENQTFISTSDPKRVMTPTPAPGTSEIYDALLAGFEGSVVARSSQGIEKLYSAKRMPTTGWVVELALPTTAAFEPAIGLRNALYGTATLASLIAVLVVGLIARRLMQPIAATAARIDDMSSGRSALERLPETGDEEVRHLIASFNRLTDHMLAQQAELRHNEIRLEESQRIAHVGSWGWDIVTDENVWSAETFRIFGLDPQGTAPGFDAFIALVDPEDRQQVIEAKQRAIAGSTPYQCEYRIHRPSGEVRVVRSQAEVVRDAEGRPLRMVGINADVTERRQDEARLRESEATYRSLFENMLNGFAYCQMLFEDDKPIDFIYLGVNEAFGTLTGLHDVVGKRITEVIPGVREADPDLFETYGRVARSGKPERFELYLSSLSMWFSISVYSPKADHFVAVFDVITERKVQERQILELNRTLESRVRQRTEDLERANRELEAFSYSISHDLRAPLRAINGFSQLVLEAEHEKLNKESLHMLERVAHNASRMGELIDDILEYSRSGRADMKSTNVDMGPLAHTIIEQLRDNYPNTDFHCGPLPTVRGDATMLRQVLLNLIENAGKFSSRREDARIEIECATAEGEHVFSVRDNGAGFDMRYADKLFGMFQRMHSEAQFPGTGVGLAIVKRLVERHGGRVWAESERDRGATFYFALPLPPG